MSEATTMVRGNRTYRLTFEDEFCGNALDFPGGNADERDASLRKIQRRVSDDTKKFPGHGTTTTVGAELAAI